MVEEAARKSQSQPFSILTAETERVGRDAREEEGAAPVAAAGAEAGAASRSSSNIGSRQRPHGSTQPLPPSSAVTPSSVAASPFPLRIAEDSRGWHGLDNVIRTTKSLFEKRPRIGDSFAQFFLCRGRLSRWSAGR